MFIDITSTAYTVHIELNIYKSYVKSTRSSFRRDDIIKVVENDEETFVNVVMRDGESFNLSYNQVEGAMVVATIDNVAPVDNDDLFAKLEALQQV